jgi:hypothetical protein
MDGVDDVECPKATHHGFDSGVEIESSTIDESQSEIVSTPPSEAKAIKRRGSCGPVATGKRQKMPTASVLEQEEFKIIYSNRTTLRMKGYETVAETYDSELESEEELNQLERTAASMKAMAKVFGDNHMPKRNDGLRNIISQFKLEEQAHTNELG